MASKQVTAKRGQTVKIRVNRKARVHRAPKTEDRRYGPPPALDPTGRPPTKTTVYFLDSNTGYSPAGNPVNTSGTAHAYKPEEIDFPDPGGFVDRDSGATIAAHRFGKIGSTAWYDPEFVDGKPQIRVKNPNTGNIFKTIFAAATLNKNKSDIYQMGFVLGSKHNPLLESNGNFKFDPTPEQRLETVNALIDEQGELPELVERRDNILLEIEELLPSNYSDKLRWDDAYREWAVPSTRLEAKGTGKTWKVVTTGLYFEPFNPFDTENFKVTQGSFGDEEVPAPKLSGSKALYIILAPQTWFTTSQWDGYVRGGDNVVRHRHVTALSIMAALTSPVGLQTIRINDSHMKTTYPIPPSQYDPLAVDETIYYTFGGYEPFTFPVAAPAFAGGGPASTPQAFQLTGGFAASLATDTLVANARLKVEAGDSAAEKNVGGFYYKEQFYNVFRKTVRERAETTLIYNGRVDSLSNPLGVVLTGDNLSYSFFDSFYPGHGSASLGNFFFNLRP